MSASGRKRTFAAKTLPHLVVHLSAFLPTPLRAFGVINLGQEIPDTDLRESLIEDKNPLRLINLVALLRQRYAGLDHGR